MKPSSSNAEAWLLSPPGATTAERPERSATAYNNNEGVLLAHRNAAPADGAARVKHGDSTDFSAVVDEDELVTESADGIAGTIVEDAIRQLKKMTDCRLSGDDSHLENVWEEICVQMQDVESFAWDAHANAINSILVSAVEALKPSERLAVWFNTEGGEDWGYENDDDGDDGDDPHDTDNEPVGQTGRDKNLSAPVDVDEIVDYLTDLLLTEAENFENANILAYLDRDIDI